MKPIAHLLAALSLLSAVGLAGAADPAPAPAPAKPAAGSAASKFAAAANAAAGNQADSGKDANVLSTNVIGSQEAPTVLNVVPWKDKEVKLEKKSPTTSILNQVLQPLDRDVLKREVQYFRSLQEQQPQ
ncbi:MAG: hypothetical protein ACOY33_06195 [Pseudomonadota bacterium]